MQDSYLMFWETGPNESILDWVQYEGTLDHKFHHKRNLLMSIPPDYEERVYAGVLGKIIGVYLGRPVENWSCSKIMAELGEIRYYVHDRLGQPLIVTDDDISGTFTFLRAMQDYGNSPDLTPAQIGQTWLNYIIEKRTILWWGGLGNSTEHTAYLRLKKGIQAPLSGSIAMNGKVVAEQIGAQIFIDGWAMVAPGDPELAADLARRAASVSHAGEAIYGAQVIAAMESQAFIEPRLETLLDTATGLIPRDSVIFRMIADLRTWRAGDSDWRSAFGSLSASYGYDRYGGNCHMVPNHGLIILSLLYGDDDFQKTLMIANTCGWDTDCNSGNVGCLMGIKNGLASIDAGPDWRGPVADRLYLPTADGGRAISDALTETYYVANAGRALAGQTPSTPKGGARFHFSLAGAVQGFMPEDSDEPNMVVSVENQACNKFNGQRCLAINYQHLPSGQTARACRATFIPPQAMQMPGYQLLASPQVYPGQVIKAEVAASSNNHSSVDCRLYLRAYTAGDVLQRACSPSARLEPGSHHEFVWQLPLETVHPIAEVGVEVSNSTVAGTVYLNYLTWDGEPQVTFTRPTSPGYERHSPVMWRKAWVDGLDGEFSSHAEPFRLVQNDGTGLLIQGTREWKNYRVSADVTPHLVESAGIAARVQGMRRYYALTLYRDGKLRLVKALDGLTVLGEVDFPWEFGETHDLSLKVDGSRLSAWIDDQPVFDLLDNDRPLTSGAIALVCQEGRTATQSVTIS
jgi:ADP-ribosylglycohydrolase